MVKVSDVVKLDDGTAEENGHTKLRALSAAKKERSSRRAEEAASRVRPRVSARARLALWPRGRVGGRKGCGFSRGTLVLGVGLA